MITFKNITRSDEAAVTYWEKIYMEAFPTDERAPINILLDLTEELDGAQMPIVYDDDQPVGIIFMNNMNTDRALILYLAMDASLRGKGYGAKVLAALQATYPMGIILETEVLDAEAENAEQRERRYGFYQRNGLMDSQLISYTLGGLFHLMRSSEFVTMDDYLKGIEQLGAIPGIPTFVFNKSNLDTFRTFVGSKLSVEDMIK